VQKIYSIKIIDLEEFGVFRPFNFVKINDSIFIIQDLKDVGIFNLIKLPSKKVINGVNRGQGPNEVLNVPASLQYRDGKILTHDFMQKKISEIVLLPDSILTIKEIYRVDTEVPALFMMHQLDSTFIAVGVTGIFEDYWLAEMNKEGRVLSTIDYPMWKETKNIRNNLTFPTLHTAVAANSPNNKRIVAATQKQGVISFLNRTDSGIKEYKRMKYHAPKFRITERGAIATSIDNIEGFMAIDCDDDYVYVLYSGKTLKQYGEQFQRCEHLLVYDWEGNPIKRYILNIPMTRLQYDKENNRIYGLAENPEGVLVQYQLSDIR
jgi:hypothetical protein